MNVKLRIQKKRKKVLLVVQLLITSFLIGNIGKQIYIYIFFKRDLGCGIIVS